MIPIGTNIGKEIWPGPGLGSPMRLLPGIALIVIGGMFLCLVLAGPVHLTLAVLRAFRRFLDSRTVLTTGPLTELLHATLTAATWKCPTFATIACSREVFLTNEWTDATAEDVAKSLNVPSAELTRDYLDGAAKPVTERALVPVYERVDGRPINEAVEIILASAALPFGLVPHVMRNGEHYVDGGVADNVPWFPVLDFELDELIIIVLEPYDSEASVIAELDVSAQGRSDRLNAFLDFEAPIPSVSFPEDIDVLRRQTEWLRSRRGTFPYEHFPVVRVLYPTRSLGGFLRGTMNFDGEYARELMRLGMKDTYARFRP